MCVQQKNCKVFEYSLWKNDKPITIYWLNYFDYSTINAIGNDIVLSLVDHECLNDGYYFKLQNIPIDAENESHIANQTKIANQLGLY